MLPDYVIAVLLSDARIAAVELTGSRASGWAALLSDWEFAVTTSSLRKRPLPRAVAFRESIPASGAATYLKLRDATWRSCYEANTVCCYLPHSEMDDRYIPLDLIQSASPPLMLAEDAASRLDVSRDMEDT